MSKCSLDWTISGDIKTATIRINGGHIRFNGNCSKSRELFCKLSDDINNLKSSKVAALKKRAAEIQKQIDHLER